MLPSQVQATQTTLIEPMQLILNDLRDSSRAHIVLAVVDDLRFRQESMTELRKQLQGQYALFDFDYAQAPQLSLPRFTRGLRHDLPVCVFADGLAELKKTDGENTKQHWRCSTRTAKIFGTITLPSCCGSLPTRKTMCSILLPISPIGARRTRSFP